MYETPLPHLCTSDQLCSLSSVDITKTVSEEYNSIRGGCKKTSPGNISESLVELRMGAHMTVHASECPIQVKNLFCVPKAKSILVTVSKNYSRKTICGNMISLKTTILGGLPKPLLKFISGT